MSSNALLALMGEESKVKTTGDDGDEGIGCHDLTASTAIAFRAENDVYVVDSPRYPELLCIDSYNTSLTSYPGFYAVGNGRPVSLYTGFTRMPISLPSGAFCQYSDNGDAVVGMTRVGLTRVVPFTTSYDRKLKFFLGANQSGSGCIAIAEDGTVYAHPKCYPLAIAKEYLGVSSTTTTVSSLVTGVAKFPVPKKAVLFTNEGFGTSAGGTSFYGDCLYLIDENDTLYVLGTSSAFNIRNCTELTPVLSHVKDFFIPSREGCLVVLRTYGELEYYGYTFYSYYMSFFGAEKKYLYEDLGRGVITSLTDVYGNNIMPYPDVSGGYYTSEHMLEENWFRGVVLCKGVKDICHASNADSTAKLVGVTGSCQPFGCITNKKELVVFGNQNFFFDDFYNETQKDDRFGAGAKVVATDVDKAWFVAGVIYFNSKGKSYRMGLNICGTLSTEADRTSENVAPDYPLTSDFSAKLYYAPTYCREPLLYAECEIYQVADMRQPYTCDYPEWFSVSDYQSPEIYVSLKNGYCFREHTGYYTNVRTYEPFKGELQTPP
jgi:hypothetical protein